VIFQKNLDLAYIEAEPAVLKYERFVRGKIEKRAGGRRLINSIQDRRVSSEF
jgi:hypothetical protein